MTPNAIPIEAIKSSVAGRVAGCDIASGAAVGVGVEVGVGSGEEVDVRIVIVSVLLHSLVSPWNSTQSPIIPL